MASGKTPIGRLALPGFAGQFQNSGLPKRSASKISRRGDGAAAFTLLINSFMAVEFLLKNLRMAVSWW
jgi:hypothetical protein